MLYHCDRLTFQILTVQQFGWTKYHRLVPPRPYSSLTYRVHGGGNFRMGDREFSTAPGDVLYLPADEAYDADYTDNEIIVVHFLQNDYAGSGENYSFGHQEEFGRLFRNLFETWKQPETTVFECNAILYQILAALRTYSQEEYDPKDAFHRAVKMLQQNFRDPQLSLAGICRDCGLSEATLRAKFVREYNLPPVKYLQNLRISYATRLLSERTLSVEEIAEASGFADSKYFSRVIKKAHGVPPSRLFTAPGG